MESLLLFFIVGLLIYITKLLVKKQTPLIRLPSFVGSGFIGGGLITLLTDYPLGPTMQIPWGITAIIGGLAGIILYGTEKGKLITRPGIQYFVTIFLGLCLASLSYGLIHLYKTFFRAGDMTLGNGTLPLIVFVLVGFITIFGYTFPERWFAQKK